jgi:FxsC-like protein
MKEAKALKNILAVVVDPWSVSLPSFDRFTQQLDDEELPTSGVIVAWNQKDDETAGQLPILKNKLTNRFLRRQERHEYFNDTVSTPESFCDALNAMFNTAQARLLEREQLPTAGPGTVPPSVKP